VIAQYQKWKEQGESLRAQAKQAMEARFRELLSVQIAEEYRRDFGGALKPAAPVIAFRYKAPAEPRRKKAGRKPAPKSPEPGQAAAKSDPKVARLQKHLVTVKTKLEAAKAANKPTRNLEDRVYEIEDEIRLATQPSA
jgi:hypothetical protein